MRKIVSRLFKIVPLIVAVGLISMPRGLAPSQAQGGGGVIIEGNFGGDPKNLNPIIGNDSASNEVYQFLFPSLNGVDPKTTDIVPNAPGGLAAGWKISDDGKTYTVTLRDGLKWSDGQPITAKDVEFSWNAIINPAVGSPYTYIYTKNGGTIDSMKALDDKTVEVKFSAVDCRALGNMGIRVVPAHLFKADASDMANSPFNTNPNVTWGPFQFKEYVPSERVTLVASPDYPDALSPDHKVKPDGWIYKAVADQTVLYQQFVAGETNFINGPTVSRRAELKKMTDKITVYDFPGNSWDYLGWNLADPKNPQPAVDKNGKPIDQGHHPLFGDVAVRQALAKAVDVDAIIKTAVFGEGIRMPSAFIPASWAFDKTLPLIKFDPVEAGKELDAAGFPMGPDGKVRVAKGAKYAKDGTPFKFTLLTNKGNSRRGAIVTIIQSQLKDIGVQVDLQILDFNTLLETMFHETFDAYVLGWLQSFPDDPDLTQILTGATDIISSANSDAGSYNNPQVNDLVKKALTVPGCKREDRAAIYKQIGKIVQDDQPYLFLFAVNGEYAAQKTVQGFDPLPSQPYWNIDTWTVKAK
ncbi:MAG TPA: ABC transporter substrate-binding protein [Aggregatilineales bacterium]|nr:ABC transporter substrate-binding protein [Aggregatilineales bacterium]